MLQRIIVLLFLLTFSFLAYAFNVNVQQCTQAQKEGGQTGLVAGIKSLDTGCDASNFIENAFGDVASIDDPKTAAGIAALSLSVKAACSGALSIASGMCEYCSKNANNCIQCGNYMRGQYGGANPNTRLKICVDTWTSILKTSAPGG